MFYNCYQTGNSIELLNPESKNLISTWRIEGQVKKGRMKLLEYFFISK